MSNFLCCKPKHLSLKKELFLYYQKNLLDVFHLRKKDSDFVYSAEFLAWNWWNIYDFFFQIKVLKTQWMGISGIFRVAASRKRPSATAERDQELFFRGKNGFEKRSWTLLKQSVENPLTFEKFEPTSRSITGSIIVLYPLLIIFRVSWSWSGLSIGTHDSAGFSLDSGLQRTRRG